ncbi:MAG TPA: thioredoxin domain-containing protein [Terriglobia bacterium]|nr:thioredoxin domain-containing protein [Terriglobia bacterium]
MRTAIALMAVVGCLGAGTVQRSSAQSESKKLAVVNGEPITEGQVEQEANDALSRLELKRTLAELSYTRDRSEALEQALNNMLAERLIRLEAGKQKLTVDALLDKEIEAQTPPPSDEAVAAFWAMNGPRIGLPREEALPEIREYLHDQARDLTFRRYLEGLKKQYGVEVYFEPARTMVETQGFPTRGGSGPSTPVTIVEFSDFECPFCGLTYPAIKEALERYKDKVRLVYRQYPLPSHPHAPKAAEASLCANDQQRFWEMHDAMFTDQENLDVPSLKEKAAKLKLNTGTFDTCLDSGKYTAAVRRDIQEGSRVGVTGTPAMFVNGRYFSGALTFDELSRVIEDELRRAEKQGLR